MFNDGPKVAVADYGLGNFRSVVNMVRRLGLFATEVKKPSELDTYTHLILPGVGAFDRAMSLLNENGWVGAIHVFSEAKRKNVLGICLGSQLLGHGSEEGEESGLGILDFYTKKFPNDLPDPIPHMRWNSAMRTRRDHPWLTLASDSRFYFAHSFYTAAAPELTYATTNYGMSFPSIIGVGNVTGVQFHPEKSHKFGLELLKGFVSAK